MVNSGSESDRESNSLTREGRVHGLSGKGGRLKRAVEGLWCEVGRGEGGRGLHFLR